MKDIDRRAFLGSAAAATAAVSSITVAASGRIDPLVKPLPTNPLGTVHHTATICTADLDASIHFYVDVMGFVVESRGKLKARNSSVPGLPDGAKYVLIHSKTRDSGPPARGVLRLIELPANAPANRPRPQALIGDTGFAVIQGGTKDSAASFETLTKAGAKTISPPQDYNHYGIKPFPGTSPGAPHDFEVRSYSAFGPAGEQIFITVLVSFDGKPPRPADYPGLHGPLGGCDLFSTDRWPVMEYYERVLGLKPTRDTFTDQANVVRLTGAPLDTYYHFSPLGEGNNTELWEFRQRNPKLVPNWPTDLTRTGLAMSTFLTNDLDVVKARIKATGIKTLGEGALPVPGMETQDAVFLRGPVNELIEVIGRGT